MAGRAGIEAGQVIWPSAVIRLIAEGCEGQLTRDRKDSTASSGNLFTNDALLGGARGSLDSTSALDAGINRTDLQVFPALRIKA